MTSWRIYVFLFAFMCMIDCTEGGCHETLSKLGVSSEGLEKYVTVMNTKPQNMLACSLRHACPNEENTTYCHLLYYCILDKDTSEFPLESCKGSSSKNVTLHYIGCIIAQIRNYSISGCDDYKFIFAIHSKMLNLNESDRTTTTATTTIATTAATTTTTTTTTTTQRETTAEKSTSTAKKLTGTTVNTPQSAPATLSTATQTKIAPESSPSIATTLTGTTVNTPQSAPATLSTATQTKIAPESSPSIATTLTGATVSTSQLTATPARTTLSGTTTQTKTTTETSPSAATTLTGATVNATATPERTTLSRTTTQTKTTAVVTSIKTSRTTTTTQQDTSSARAKVPQSATTTAKVQPSTATNATCTCSHRQGTQLPISGVGNTSSAIGETEKNVLTTSLMVSVLLNAVMLVAFFRSRRNRLRREQSMTFTEMHEVSIEDPPPPLYPNDLNGEGSHLMQVRVAEINQPAAEDPSPPTYGDDNSGTGSALLQKNGCWPVTLKSTGETPCPAPSAREHQETY